MASTPYVRAAAHRKHHDNNDCYFLRDLLRSRDAGIPKNSCQHFYWIRGCRSADAVKGVP